MSQWKLSRDGLSAARLMDNGLTEVKSVSHIDAIELSAALPADPMSQQEVISAIAKTYTDVDSLYATAVGNRAEEYRQAETAALAYQAAGYSGVVSEYVSSWASANPPMTNTQSADVIIARASTLRTAMASVRTQRFVSQAAMRAATTRAELDVAVAAWDAFISQTRSALV